MEKPRAGSVGIDFWVVSCCCCFPARPLAVACFLEAEEDESGTARFFVGGIAMSKSDVVVANNKKNVTIENVQNNWLLHALTRGEPYLVGPSVELYTRFWPAGKN